MRRRAALVVVGLAVVAAVAVAGIPTLSALARKTHRGFRVTVRPTVGVPSTSFVVRFQTPERTGQFGSTERHYEVSVSGPAGTRCSSSASANVPPSKKGTNEKIGLTGQQGGWCVGRFHGTVEEIQMASCPPRSLCPQYVLGLRTLGRFAFSVKAPRDQTPPAFAGIVSAIACTPGPQRADEATPFSLTWKAARDSVTPSSQIVYDVYMSPTQGGESFVTPTWRVPTGATRFKTPGLASHGTFYFVVRARDRAGNEDHNRVELRGVDPCY